MIWLMSGVKYLLRSVSVIGTVPFSTCARFSLMPVLALAEPVLILLLFWRFTLGAPYLALATWAMLPFFSPVDLTKEMVNVFPSWEGSLISANTCWILICMQQKSAVNFGQERTIKKSPPGWEG